MKVLVTGARESTVARAVVALLKEKGVEVVAPDVRLFGGGPGVHEGEPSTFLSGITEVSK